jgi:hypothetical protein
MRSYQNFEFPYPLIKSSIPQDLSIAIVIPAYLEPDLMLTLESLKKNEIAGFTTEVIAVLNQSENADDETDRFHRTQLEKLNEWAKVNNTDKLRFHNVFADKIPQKKAGVGTARKIGMDEAYKRFNSCGNVNGIIACLDADCLVADNYIETLKAESIKNDRTRAYSIYFEHDITENDQAITQYELHLRYYINMQRLSGLPFAYYTVGSSMAVRAWAYGAAFGMNRRKAGEDFYFLHKFIKTGDFREINSTKVIPSARISERVPFGTGRAMLEKSGISEELTTYNPRSFDELTMMTSNLHLACKDISGFMEILPKPVSEYLKKCDIEKRIAEFKANTSDHAMFSKRFYTWFDAFRLMKFLHFMRDNYYANIPVSYATISLFEKMGIKCPDKLFDRLIALRSMDCKGL